MARSPATAGACSASARSWCASSERQRIDMSDTTSVSVDASGVSRVDGANSPPRATLPEPLQVIKRALESTETAKQEFPDRRLSRLVTAPLDLDEADIARLPEILGMDVLYSM